MLIKALPGSVLKWGKKGLTKIIIKASDVKALVENELESRQVNANLKTSGQTCAEPSVHFFKGAADEYVSLDLNYSDEESSDLESSSDSYDNYSLLEEIPASQLEAIAKPTPEAENRQINHAFKTQPVHLTLFLPVNYTNSKCKNVKIAKKAIRYVPSYKNILICLDESELAFLLSHFSPQKRLDMFQYVFLENDTSVLAQPVEKKDRIITVEMTHFSPQLLSESNVLQQCAEYNYYKTYAGLLRQNSTHFNTEKCKYQHADEMTKSFGIICKHSETMLYKSRADFTDDMKHFSKQAILSILDSTESDESNKSLLQNANAENHCLVAVLSTLTKPTRTKELYKVSGLELDRDCNIGDFELNMEETSIENELYTKKESLDEWFNVSTDANWKHVDACDIAILGKYFSVVNHHEAHLEKENLYDNPGILLECTNAFLKCKEEPSRNDVARILLKQQNPEHSPYDICSILLRQNVAHIQKCIFQQTLMSKSQGSSPLDFTREMSKLFEQICEHPETILYKSQTDFTDEMSKLFEQVSEHPETILYKSQTDFTDEMKRLSNQAMKSILGLIEELNESFLQNPEHPRVASLLCTITELLTRTGLFQKVSGLSQQELYRLLELDMCKTSIKAGLLNNTQSLGGYLVPPKRLTYRNLTSVYGKTDVDCATAMPDEDVSMVSHKYKRNEWHFQKDALLEKGYLYDFLCSCLNKIIAFIKCKEELSKTDFACIILKNMLLHIPEQSRVLALLSTFIEHFTIAEQFYKVYGHYKMELDHDRREDFESYVWEASIKTELFGNTVSVDERQKYRSSTNAYVNSDVVCGIALSEEKELIVFIPSNDRNQWHIQEIPMLKKVYMYDDTGDFLNEKLAFSRLLDQLPPQSVAYIFQKLKSEDMNECSEILVALKSGDEIKVLQSVSERCKSKPNYRLAVVTAEVFEEAMRQCQIFEYDLTYSNYFPRDCKMIIGIPVYKGGFINRRDNKDRGIGP